MSMLAERKVKQRWSLNPRGNTWINDSNNFGMKMLSKMGWSQGKGLGMKENGITEQIKVAYKNDSKGMGYKMNDEQWREHEDNFSALLETLSQSNNNNIDGSNDKKVVSLVEKSETSKARVHYKKFTRGKDLSQYSEKDLANIFGKKSLNLPTTTTTNNNGTKDDKLESSFLQNGGSMVDYFKQKLSKFHTTTANIERDSDDEKPARFGFGFGFNTQQTPDGNVNVNKRKSGGANDGCGVPKKKKKNVAIDNPGFEETLPDSPTVCRNDHFEIGGKINKNSATDEAVDDSKTIVASNGSCETTAKKKKKKKKKKQIAGNGTAAIDNPVFNGHDSSVENIQDVSNGNFEVVRQKKVKRKSKAALDNPAFDGNVADTPKSCADRTLEVTRNVAKKLKKKKQNSQDDGETQQVKTKRIVKRKSTDSVADSPQTPPIDTTTTKKKMKGKKKKMLDNHGIDNVVFDDNTEISPNRNDCHQKKDYEVSRKNLKNSKIPIDNPCFNNNSDCSGDLNQTTTTPIAPPTIADDINCDLMLNTVTTPILKAPTANRNNLHKKSVRFSDKNQQHIIPNKDDVQKLNELTVINTKIINNNLTKLSKRIDGLEAEIENDMNQAKLDNNNNDNNNNNSGGGGVVIKIDKNIKWGYVPIWLLREKCKAKSSYKHLIRGDIVVDFKNTNFDRIHGYGNTNDVKN